MGRDKWTDDKLFDRLLNNKSDSSYWDTVGELRRRPSKTVFERCAALTKSDSPKSRKVGIDVLAQLGISPRPFLKESIKLFFESLKTEKDTDVIIALLYAIGHNNDNLSASQIKKICSFTDKPLRESLTFSLLGVDNDIAIETLIGLSQDTSANIRNWATFGLGSQTEKDSPEIRNALWNRVNDKHKDTRYEAISGLSHRKDERITAIIQKELLTENYQGLLFEAIAILGDKQFLPILKEQYSRFKAYEDINPEWLNDMKNCIEELQKK